MDVQQFNEFHEFCKGVIWPLFHSNLKDVNYEVKYWQSYKQANKQFVEALFKVCCNSFLSYCTMCNMEFL